MDNGSGIITLEELEFDPDPSVFANLVVTNNSAVTQTYNFTVTQPAYLANVNNQVFGSIVVSLQDQDTPENGATLANPTGSVYTANIDGSQVDTLLSSYSLSTPPNPNGYLTSFGWDPHVGAVTSSISIDLAFTLSAGDSATVISRFDVIPEPATILLLSLGGLLLRKRK